jgi:hypothetical protein
MNQISKDGTFYYYYHSGLTLENTKWKKISFLVGPSSSRKHHENARFISGGVGVNYDGGNADY